MDPTVAKLTFWICGLLIFGLFQIWHSMFKQFFFKRRSLTESIHTALSDYSLFIFAIGLSGASLCTAFTYIYFRLNWAPASGKFGFLICMVVSFGVAFASSNLWVGIQENNSDLGTERLVIGSLTLAGMAIVVSGIFLVQLT